MLTEPAGEPVDPAGEPVERYAGAYPGPRPAWSFWSDGVRCRPLGPAATPSGYADGDGTDAGALLGAGGEPLAAVLAYGANGCPAELAARFGVPHAPVAVLHARVSGLTRAWCASRRLVDAQVPCTVVRAPGAVDAMQVAVLPASLAVALDVREGRAERRYDLVALAEVEVVAEGGGAWAAPLAYVAGPLRGVLSAAVDGGPPDAVVPLADVAQPAVRALLDRHAAEHDGADPPRCTADVAPRGRVVPAAVPLAEAGRLPDGRWF